MRMTMMRRRRKRRRWIFGRCFGVEGEGEREGGGTGGGGGVDVADAGDCDMHCRSYYCPSAIRAAFAIVLMIILILVSAVVPGTRNIVSETWLSFRWPDFAKQDWMAAVGTGFVKLIKMVAGP